ncbi:MAG: alpha/beta hydrolase [Clostridia bacterium]|nr:alpha/beta hydrolase [Clostridia bacterium]
MDELVFYRDGKRICGKLLRPAGREVFPLVIISHGFGSDMRSNLLVASLFAENGIGAFIFDFIGGGRETVSDGKMTEMSVLTESEDLMTVIDELKKLSCVDASNIVLMGKSQGGYVSTYVAGKLRDTIRAMVLYYPAYVIYDDAVKRTEKRGYIPDTQDVMGNLIGSIYEKDALSVDIFESIASYNGPVLIIHGTRDDIVPYSYSQKAGKLFSDCRLVPVEDAGHGFSGADESYADSLSVDFVKEIIK